MVLSAFLMESLHFWNHKSPDSGTSYNGLDNFNFLYYGKLNCLSGSENTYEVLEIVSL